MHSDRISFYWCLYLTTNFGKFENVAINNYEPSTAKLPPSLCDSWLVILILAILLRKLPTHCMKHKDIPDGVIGNSQEIGSNPII